MIDGFIKVDTDHGYMWLSMFKEPFATRFLVDNNEFGHRNLGVHP